ncbi:hypothetical protein ACFY40_29090 [Streptomyces sp. NPDC012950]|uniref:hypothetical protein n=1 Tax=Streptomyces sp. NPDC012950 TaxID=3364858 RepID=UPI00368D896D
MSARRSPREGASAEGGAASSGDRLLVTGAAGAVGGLAVQLARQPGVEVDGLVSRPEHVEPVRELGAGTVTDLVTDLPGRAYGAVFDTAGVDVTAALAEGGVSVSDDPLPDVPGAAKSYVQESTEVVLLS